MSSELDQAKRTLDDALRIYAKLALEHEHAICTGWVLTLAGHHPTDGETLHTSRMPGQTLVTTLGLIAHAETAWRRS